MKGENYMWICVRATERELEMVGTADTQEEILDVMYNALVSIYPDEGTLIDDINHDEAEFCDSDMFAWSNYRNIDRDWKCFWV